MPRASKRVGKARKRASKRSAKEKRPAVIAPVETSEQAIAAIAQDAVLILRRGLAYHARRAQRRPSDISLSACLALLRLVAELGPAAMKGQEVREADFEALSPEERLQFAGLLGKVIAT